MGRWAQRRRGGGGIRDINKMIAAEVTAPDTELVTYAYAVSASALDATTFHSQPSNEEGIDVFQNGANGIRIVYGNDVSLDTFLSYTGSTPGILTPQQIAFT